MMILWSIRGLLLLVCGLLVYQAILDSRIVIAAGPVTGGFNNAAVHYRDRLARVGITATVTNREQTLTIIDDVNNPGSGVDLGFTAGPVEEKRYPNVVSLGGIFYEPLFIFYRAGLGNLTRIDQLRGLRLGVAPPNSGTRVVADQILALHGLDEANSTLVGADFATANAALEEGRLDAAFYLLPAENKMIQQLAAEPGLTLMSLAQAEAISHKLDALEKVTVPMGSWDLIRNVPARDVTTVAATAQVIARRGLNSAVTTEIVRAMIKTHDSRGIIARQNEFPSTRNLPLALSGTAEAYLKNGPTFIQRNLPYWLATIFDSFVFYLVSGAVITISIFNGSQSLTKAYYLYLSLFFYERKLIRLATKRAGGEALTLAERHFVERVAHELSTLHMDASKRCFTLTEKLRANTGTG